MIDISHLLSWALPVLAVGSVNGLSLQHEINPCLDFDAADYRCSLLPGVLLLNLTSCGIADGDVEDLTACIDAVDHDPIQEIWLDDNELIALPENTFEGVPYLRHLHLEANSLDTLSSGLFSGLSELGWLHLDSNSLSSLPEGIFDELGSIEELHLDGNQLTSLHEDVFIDLETLRSLWLSDNMLGHLREETFDGVKKSLQQLHLRANDLSTLPSGLFVNLVALTFLDLSENPELKCLPSPGPNVGADYLLLPDNFTEGETCACPVTGDTGGCPYDCEAGTEGYVCSGGPTPSPVTPTPGPTSPGPDPTRAPIPSVDAPPTATATPATTPPAMTSAPGSPASTTMPSSRTTAPNASLSETTGVSITPVPATPAPTIAARDAGAGTPAPTSDSTCKNGIWGYQVGDACCTPGCEQCGGPACSTSSLWKGLDNHDCCVDTIIASGVECGGNVVAPCINYNTPVPSDAPAPSFATVPTSVADECLAKNAACQDNSTCLQCISVIADDQDSEWTDCQSNYIYDEGDACASSAAEYCCAAELSGSESCLTNDLFVAYAECSMEAATGGDECPLSCRDIVVSSINEESGATRSYSGDLTSGVSFLAGCVTLAMIIGWV